ncbi:MAG: hypothetical protein IPG76_18590 [Acidobacteria bacterium]|nr:hypothetical protein [Acidobacteriota bacterium]
MVAPTLQLLRWTPSRKTMAGMEIGINYPWIDYGWDFGDPPPAWVAKENLAAWREQKRRHIEDDFRQFASHGILRSAGSCWLTA